METGFAPQHPRRVIILCQVALTCGTGLVTLAYLTRAHWFAFGASGLLTGLATGGLRCPAVVIRQRLDVLDYQVLTLPLLWLAMVPGYRETGLPGCLWQVIGAVVLYYAGLAATRQMAAGA